MSTSTTFGASFSLHRCAELGLDKQALLRDALQDLGIRRFRLMSYWNIHEPEMGRYDFSELDWQFDMIAQYGGKVTLCLGKRQPRWPECHIPNWALGLSKEAWYEALFAYIERVVARYRNHPALESWQLENEALLRDFGYCPDNDYSRERLKLEYGIVKSFDTVHPVIMTLSDSWGLPWRSPTPDVYATSLYRITINKKGEYKYSRRPAWLYEMRASFIWLIKRRPVFIHELQAEPWLPAAVNDTPLETQAQYMNPDLFRQAVAYAKATRLRPIDLWGLEWWYWRKTLYEDDSMWQAAKEVFLS